MIVFAAIMPHPPESIPGIGTPADFAVIEKTLSAFDQLRIGLEEANIDTILIISPHAEMEEYSFVINSDSELSGSLANFGQDKVYTYTNNIEIADKLAFACSMNEEMPCELRGQFLDHGALIPLYHLTKNIKPKIVHLSFSLMSYERHYRYGEIIQKVLEDARSERGPERVAVIASGDLSHCLNANAPAGFSPKAGEFDHTIIHYLGGNDLASILGLEEHDALEARECGIRSIMILLGILHGKDYEFNLLSYEGPFGVGYLTARLL